MLRTRPLSTHIYPPFPPRSSPSTAASTSISWIFHPKTKNPETCFVHGLCPPTSTPLSPRIISICSCFNLNFLNISPYFTPKRSMFQTNPETCFVHGLCPPTSTPLSPTIISICSPFNLNLNISAHNEAYLGLTLKHASYTASVTHIYRPFPHDHF